MMALRYHIYWACNISEILTELLAYWQDPNNTLDGLTLIEAEQRNREREGVASEGVASEGAASSAPTSDVPTVVEQLQAALKEFETNPSNDKGDEDANN